MTPAGRSRVQPANQPLLLFAAAYFLMSQSDAYTFTSELSRADALYFTVTVFSTVGFGDISAQTEPARLVVSVQMMLDPVILGVGVRVILGAVERSRNRLAGDAEESASGGSG
jgi:voltage-gated potassium channel